MRIVVPRKSFTLKLKQPVSHENSSKIAQNVGNFEYILYKSFNLDI